MKIDFTILDNITDLHLGFSGGRDSVALSHYLHVNGYKFTAVHINHGVNEHSDTWEEWCREWCAKYDIPFLSHKVTVKPGNFESNARDERLNHWEQYGNVILCHHQNDQHETLLFRVLRGSGIRGLSGMQQTNKIGNANLLRPMLKTTRGQIDDYVVQHNLTWLEDPSNQDTNYDRNFIRHELLPLIKKRFGSSRIEGALNALFIAQREADQLLSEYAKDDLARLGVIQKNQVTFNIRDLKLMSKSRVKNLLRCLLEEHCPMLNLKQLDTFTNNLFSTNEDGKTFAQFGNVSCRQKGRWLFVNIN